MTVTRADLAKAVSRVAPALTQIEAGDLVDETLAQIADALVMGERVKLHEFCVFATRRKPARVGRNPRHPEVEVPITPRRVVLFKASPELKKTVDAGHRDGLNIPEAGPAWFGKAKLRRPE